MAPHKVQPTFIRPNGFSKLYPSKIRTILDLVDFNAQHNTEHTFCLQEVKGESRLVPITFSRLLDLIDSTAAWLQENRVVDGRRNSYDRNANGAVVAQKPSPIALLMGSDVSILTHMFALMKLGVPVALFSARLSPTAIAHLLSKTGAKRILTTSHTVRSANSALDLILSDQRTDVDCTPTEPIQHFLAQDAPFIGRVPSKGLVLGECDRNAIILHSSGSTGLPKPIYQSHGYLLNYAYCHEFSEDEDVGGVAASTLPLFHGFGMLPPGLSLSIGKPFALPSASTIPNGESTISLIQKSNATSLLTVPSILEDLWRVPDARGVEALQPLDFVAVGGGPMKYTVAEALSKENVSLLNHCGTTEIGALAPIFNPGAGYDWRYFVARQDIGLRFADAPGENAEGYRQLVGRASGWTEDFVVQDFLLPRPGTEGNGGREYKFVGRADDLIVLGTGEKVRPTTLEAVVSESPMVRDCLTFGAGREHLGLLVEADPSCSLISAGEGDLARFVEELWHTVQRANEHIDAHGKISKDMLVVTHPATRPLARTAKGSLARKENFDLFATEIEEVYARASTEIVEPLPDLTDGRKVAEYLREAVSSILDLGSAANELGENNDLFEFGMNSLQATRLTARLAAAVKASPSAFIGSIDRNFVYAHSTILLMRDALVSGILDGTQAIKSSKTGSPRLDTMLKMVDKYSRAIDALPVTSTTAATKTTATDSDLKVVLLTGSTGSLGSNVLYHLAHDPTVRKIICFNRQQKSSESQQDRQNRSFRKAGLTLPEELWAKIKLLQVQPQAERFGLDDQTYDLLMAQGVSHIIHNAWPMDFNRTLGSFTAQFDYLMSLLTLVTSTPTPKNSEPTRILFTSSIAAVARYQAANSDGFQHERTVVPEAEMRDPAVSAPFGYPEAKWVCERIIHKAACKFRGEVEGMVVRVGQLTGSFQTGRGWATTEHLPGVFRSSIAVGKVPKIGGVLSWTPVDIAASTIKDILFSPPSSPSAAERPSTQFFHLENPNRILWSQMLDILSRTLSSPTHSTSPLPIVPFAEWLELVKTSDHTDPDINPAKRLISFLENDFLRLGTGRLALGTDRTEAVSQGLGACRLGEQYVERLVTAWGWGGENKA